MIYVDDARIPATVGRIKGRWSHLATDSPDIEELHRFAVGIGLQREWFQAYTKRPPGLYRPHYDLTESKRGEAVSAGAVQISWREFPDVLRRAREASQALEGQG